jgi:hypothetical protein
MNKPLLLSVAAAAILVTNLNAESMYNRIQSMELQMKQMERELSTLKSAKATTTAQKTKSDSEEDTDDEEDDEDETSKVSDKTQKSTKSSLIDEEEDEEDEPEKIDVEEEIADIKENLTELNKATNGSHLKFGVDYRFALDNMQYTMADGSKTGNDAFMTNRLWINMDWKATNHLSFSGQLAYNKAFGQRTDDDNAGYNFENFDWVANENAYDDVIRVRSAYFLYKNDTFFSVAIPWTFSIGRRPSTNGHLINMRDDDGAASPMGHTINVEFDGLSSKFGLEDLTGINGMYVKFCAGRGMTSAAHKFTATPYANEDNINPNIDLAGLIFVPWNNGHYGIATQYYYANNLIDQQFDNTGKPLQTFSTVGGLHSFTANLTINGIGNEWSDYLDDTTLFVSGAVSVTNPDREYAHINPSNGTTYMSKGMLGSSKSEAGYSVWVGLQMPSLMSEDGRWGVEYNKGSAYWRSITYGEDTNIGSKIATRGDAYEAYFTEPLVDDILSLQVRYTYIDYKYSGSNGFFGDTTGSSTLINSNMPMASNYADTAQDIRFYLRYRY